MASRKKTSEESGALQEHGFHLEKSAEDTVWVERTEAAVCLQAAATAEKAGKDKAIEKFLFGPQVGR